MPSDLYVDVRGVTRHYADYAVGATPPASLTFRVSAVKDGWQSAYQEIVAKEA